MTNCILPRHSEPQIAVGLESKTVSVHGNPIRPDFFCPARRPTVGAQRKKPPWRVPFLAWRGMINCSEVWSRIELIQRLACYANMQKIHHYHL